MSTAVSDALLEPTRRPVAVDALTDVIDAEVADKSGIGGAAVKTGYAAAKKLGGNFVTSATDRRRATSRSRLTSRANPTRSPTRCSP
jgi:hypothetical protein